MKKTMLIIAGLAATVSLMAAEANLNFANKATGVNAVVTDAQGGAKLDGGATGEYMAMLYWAPLGQPSLTPVIDVFKNAAIVVAFRTGAAAGYITATALNVQGATAGVAIQVQMRAWSRNGGATYEEAYTAATTGGMAATVKLGSSNIFEVTPTTPPAVGAPLVGLTAFSIDYIPEPSVLALGLLGGVAFLLRRRS